MNVKNIQIDDLECSPEAYEWCLETEAKTIGELIKKYPDPHHPTQDKYQKKHSLLVGDNICQALGYFIWKKLSV